MLPKFLKIVKSQPVVTLPIYLGILCGFYFNIGSRRFSKLIGLYCVLSFCPIAYSAFQLFHHRNFLMSYFIEYTLRFLLMICGCGKRYLNYMTNLQLIDNSIGITQSYRCFLLCYIYMAFMAIEPAFLWFSLSLTFGISSNFMACLFIMINELNKIYGLMFLESFWRRLKLFSKDMQHDVQNVIYGTEIISSKIQKRLRLYLEVLKNYETAYTLISVQVKCSNIEKDQ